MQIKYDSVKGYATYAAATKRGQEVETLVAPACGAVGKDWKIRWLVVAKQDGRFLPAFYCGDVPGGPGMFLGLTNVCVFN